MSDGIPPLSLVQAWQNAANRQDLDQLLALSHSEIEIIGPRGKGSGHQLLRDWLKRAGLSLTTQRAFVRDDNVVVTQHGVWRSLETGEITGEAEVASWFRVADHRIVHVARYESLEAALEAAGLAYTDETTNL